MIIYNYKIFLLFFLSIGNSFSLLNQKEFVDKLLYLVEQKSDYSSIPGNNMLNYKNEIFYCDCSGMIKALLNGYDFYNVTEGSQPSDFNITGDKNSKQLIDNCEDISEHFYLLTYNSATVRFLYKEGHIGVFIGQEVLCGNNTDEVCNVVECTSSWLRGIQLSYVDTLGNRYNKKGGKKEDKWTKHGLPTKWVEYNCEYIFNPQNGTDCILTSEDKKLYNYCCYEKNTYSNKCFPYNKEDYEFQLLTIDTLKKNGLIDEFECFSKNVEIPESSDCEQIKPKRASDCKLSDEDKKTFKYCCYEGSKDGIVECSSYTQETYDEKLKYYNLFKDAGKTIMECNIEDKEKSESNSYFISYFNIWIILMLLLL